MTLWQTVFLGSFFALNALLFFRAVAESISKKNAYGWTVPLIPLGMFVWGDVLIISIFWVGVSVVSLFLADWLLFWLLFSLFWVVRNAGEALFWFLQQFSQKVIYKPEELPGYNLVQNESIYFIYQVINQLSLVIFLFMSLWLGTQWFG